MNYLGFDLGMIGPQQTAVISLSMRARVLLLDETNYAAYRCGGAWNGQGGWAVQTPVYLRPDHYGHWHVVVDLEGGSGQVRASVQLAA